METAPELMPPDRYRSGDAHRHALTQLQGFADRDRDRSQWAAETRPYKHSDESPGWVHTGEPDKLGLSREDR
ncbi:hypothetical protein GCM10008965_52660 [Methylorubrum aminovorans]|nr:hypothetical protein GCM10025880_09210 [Methylorubrum aminovorans]